MTVDSHCTLDLSSRCAVTLNGRPGIMVLDDVLIGLDLSHRLPLLTLLKEEFGDWQLLLLTHDRTWYDLAQLETALEGGWTTSRASD